jgi:hypothetical protein
MINTDGEDLDLRAKQLLHLVENFRYKIRNGTSDPDHFMTISEIERLWSELRGSTDALYADMLCEMLAEIDEAGILRKKKLNTGKEE